MNLHDDDTLFEKLVELLSAPEKGGIRHLLQVALDACMLAERRKHLGVGPYERSEERVDHANGFKDRTLKKLGSARSISKSPRCEKVGSSGTPRV